MDRFQSDTITTERLILVPLRPEDADEMVGVLGDERLHEFIGGRPATLAELRDKYVRFVAGPSRPGEVWLNWIVRHRADSQPVGTVQATITTHDRGRTAHIAWVIGVEWQNQGFASEAALALVDWLRHLGVDDVVANIHRDHRASAVVATRAGLEPTEDEADGEQVWRNPEQQKVSLPDSSDTYGTLCHNPAMNAIRVKVGPKGRVVVPAAIRKELGIEEGTELMARVEGDGLVLEPRAAALRRLRELFAHVPRDRSLVDELIAERREEARREAEG